MKALSSSLILAALAVLLGACPPQLDLPPAPDVQARLDAFENPDAVVRPEIMSTVASGIADLHDEIDQSSFYGEILDVIVQVQNELYDENGKVDLGGGVTYESPNGGVTIDYICEGWEDPPPTEPDPANGEMELNMRLAAGSIAPLVWGSVNDCRYTVPIGQERLEALYRGMIAVHFGEPLSPAGDLYAVPVIFVAGGSIVVEGSEFPINDLFRVTFAFDEEGNLLPGLVAIDMLVELADDTSFVYSFKADLTEQLRDGVGTLRCNLEDRNCTSEEDPSRTFSW